MTTATELEAADILTGLAKPDGHKYAVRQAQTKASIVAHGWGEKGMDNLKALVDSLCCSASLLWRCLELAEERAFDCIPD